MSLLRILSAAILALLALTARGVEAPDAFDETSSIFGVTMVSADNMFYFVSERNAEFPYEIAEAFYTIGERYGIRADVALCQAILETGWFKFERSAVTPDMHNYGGLGVTGPGAKGDCYDSIAEGVTAFMQHLYAYGCREALPDGEDKVDKRFDLVARGCAPSWSGLTMRWAMNRNYATDIIRIYRSMRDFDPNN